MEKQPTTIIGADGVEYVVRGGKIVEKCQHQTTTDKSSGKVRHIVCHDCGKTIIYNGDTSRNELQDFYDRFRSIHGRNPRGVELYAAL